MAASSSRNDVVQEISLLYELALAVGTSLDLEANCETFLRTLVARKNLEFAAVWLHAHHLDPQADSSGYHVVSACPAFRVRAEAVPVEPQWAALQPGEHLTLRAGAPGFDDFAPGGVGVEGTTALLPIGQLGLLQLYNRPPDGFADRELDQLRSVLRTLATSIEGCLAHRRLQTEVAERRRTATSLRAVTSRLRALISNMQAGVLVEDEGQRAVLANEAFCELFGLEVSPDQLVEAPFSHTAAGIKDAFADPNGFVAQSEVLAGRREVVTSQELTLRDGRILERDYVPIYSEGAFRGHLLQYRDVTERKRAEREVVRLKNFYEQVLDKMPVQLAVFDTEGRYEYVTPSSVKDPAVREWLVGRTDVEYCEQRGVDVAVGQQRLEALEQVAETQEEHAFEEAFVGRDGRKHHFLRVITPVVEEGRTVQLLGYGLDITDRKQAEEELRESEERFQEVLRSLDAVVWSISIAEERLLYVSPAAEHVYGYPLATFEEDLWTWMRAVHPDDLGWVEEHVEHLLAEGTSDEIEYRIVRPDGGVRWVNDSHQVTRDAAGRPLRVSGFVTDVTDRKRAEEELRESEERYQEVLRSLDAVVWSVSLVDERMLFINPAAQQVYGYPPEAFEEDLWLWLKLVHPEDRDEVRAAMDRLEEEGLTSQEMEYRIVRPDGEVRWLFNSHAMVRDAEGRPVRVSGFVTDITDRKQAEEELTRIRKAVEGSSDAVAIADAQGRIIFQNQTFLDLFGFTVEDFAAMDSPEGMFVDPETGREIVEALMSGRSWMGDVEARTAYGTTVDVSMRADALTNEAGDFIGIMGILTDISERKHMEAELRRAKQAAEASAQAKERFLANVSHEMRTPLNALVGMTHLLRTTEPTNEQERYLDGIRFSTDNLLVLINDLLDVAKLEAGKVEFEAVPFNLAALLQRLNDTMQIRAQEKELELRVEPGETLPSAVLGDPTRLSQILLNLVSNAIKFTDEGEVVVRAEPVPEADGAIRFVVQDTGIGISEDQRDRIFQSFTQAGSDTTRKYGGTGLGLAIVKELVERQGGTIRVESTEGVGTTFSVVLPLPPTEDEVAPPVSAAAPAEGEPASLEGARILLVEDNEMSQIVTARMLRHWGAEVDVADDGAEAVAHVAETAYDLVLMDIQMPGMDGVEATRHIRERPGCGLDELPILALTAASLSDERHAAIKAVGINDFVFKPFDPERLRSRIGAALAPVSDSPQPAADAEEVNLSMLERNAFGDDGFVLRMINMFCQNVPAQLETMQQAAEGEAWPEVRFTAHKLKSTAGMVGAEELRMLMREVEERIDEGRLDGLHPLVGQAVQQGRRVLDMLEAQRARYQ